MDDKKQKQEQRSELNSSSVLSSCTPKIIKRVLHLALYLSPSLRSTADMRYVNLWFLSQHINHRARSKIDKFQTRPTFFSLLFFRLGPRSHAKKQENFYANWKKVFVFLFLFFLQFDASSARIECLRLTADFCSIKKQILNSAASKQHTSLPFVFVVFF